MLITKIRINNKMILIFIFYLFLFVKNIYSKDKIYIFISSSMPESSIISLMKEVKTITDKKYPYNAGLLLNGLVKNSLKSTAVYTLNLLKNAETEYGLIIYPPYFNKFKVKVVPTFIRIANDNRIVKMIGDVKINFFYEKSTDALLKNKKSNFIDLGCWGKTYPIKEKSIETLIAERLKNFEEKKIYENMRKSFFKNLKTVSLPRAKKNYKYLVDMSVILDKDIYTPNGELIYKAGTVINPLEKFNYDKYIIFFDGTDKKQVDFVKNLVKKEKRKKYVLLVTNFDTSNTINFFNLQNQIKQKIYFAGEYAVKRFKIKELPSIAHQKKQFMEIKVIALNKEKRGDR